METYIYQPRFTLLGKIYVWSIVLTPLLFFVVAHRGITGVSGNLSRLLELIVIVGLVVKALEHPKSISIPNLFNPLYRNYFLYLLFAVIAGCYGFFTGAYKLHEDSSTTSASFLGSKLNGPWVRPFFEYFIALYYFLYFTVLPRYLLSSVAGIDYFFKVFSGFFLLSLWLGVIDLLLYYFVGYEWIPRHLGDGMDPGFRFHGLAGEPRDAFVYLVMGLGMLALRDIWRHERRLNLFYIVLISMAALLTQSASGLIGLVLAGILIMLFYMPKVSISKFMMSVFILGLMVAAILVTSINSVRVLIYLNAFVNLYEVLESGHEVESILKVAMNNIYPIWHRWLEALESIYLPLMIGTGFGSASVVNNNFLHSNELLNPNANIIRSIYENGIIGTYLFIIAFLIPIKKLFPSRRVYYKLTLMILLLIGSFLAHRSTALFIFLGIVIVVLTQKKLLQQQYGIIKIKRIGNKL